MRRLAAKLGLVIILMLAISVSLFIMPMFTGFLIYSSWSNELTAYNETNITGTNNSQGFWKTKTYNSLTEQMKESSDRLQWIFDFNTTYNVTSPAELVIKAYGVSFAESANITIYNHDTGGWDNVAQTTIATFPSYTNSTTNLNWSNRNLSNYINQTTGFVKIGFEDINSANGAQDTLYIDYLALNATFSPLTDEQFSIANASGATYFSAENYTRYNYTRADMLWVGAEWNASNVTYGTAIINASGNVSEWYIGNTTANWTYANLTLSNVTMFPTGGNVTVSFTANDSFWQYNTSHIMAYFGLFSNASVTSLVVNETGNVVAQTPVKVYCRVADTYSNVPVAGYNVSFYNNSNLFNYALTNSTGWASSVYNGTASGGSDYFLNCSIGNATGIWYYNSSAWNQSTTMAVVPDSLQPNITGLYLDSAGVSSSYRTNLYMNAGIIANATDSTTSVQSATLNITYPSGFFVAASMQRHGGTGWRFVFADNETNAGGNFALNQTGNYTVNLTAYDLSGNANMSWNITFNVTSNYSVVLDGYSNGIKYNRGENLTFVVLDENGVAVAGSNITANLTYPTNTVSSWYSGTNSTYMLALNGTLNVTNYTMMFFANKSMGGNNSAYGGFSFNVTDVLQINFAINPSNSYAPSLAEDIRDRVRVYANNTRGGRFPYNVGWVNLTCYGGGTHNLSKQADEYYYNGTMNCYAPNAYSTSFTLSVAVNDTATNNTGSGTLTLATASAPGGGSSGGGGGGGGGTVTKNCSCEWTSTDLCGTGGCASTQVLQRWVCNPDGCKLPDGTNSTTRCIYSLVFCELNRRGFNFTVSRDYVEVKRGENATVMGTVSNTGNLTLNISLAIANGCCRVFAAQSVVVQNLSSLDLPITVHPALLEELGDYLFTVNATTEGLGASKGFTVRVTENQLLIDIQSYQAGLDQLKGGLAIYANNGLDISGIAPLAEEIEGIINSANASAAGDRLAEFQAQLSQAKAKLDDAVAKASQLGLLNFLVENRWWILTGIIVAFIALYLTTQIAVPYVQLTREIKRMIDREKSQVEGRKATYKDYFMGKVDEKAFEEMIIGKQSEILSTKGSLRHKMDERNALIRSRLSPGAMAAWLKSGFGLRTLLEKMKDKKK